MNLANCANLPTQPERQTWYRAIQVQYLGTPLQTSHKPGTPSRYNEGNRQFEILYFADNHQVALYEVEAMLGSPLYGVTLPNPYFTWTILNVQVQLNEVVDLTNTNNQVTVQTSAQELTGDWRSYQLRSPTMPIPQPTGPAPTQQLGAALYGVAPIEGFLTLSARVPTQRILAVFPQKLAPGGNSFVKSFDQHGNLVASIP
jgi:hypothetical protein